MHIIKNKLTVLSCDSPEIILRSKMTIEVLEGKL